MLIALDTETYLIEPAQQAPRMVCGQFCSPGKEPIVVSREQALLYFEEYLDDPTIDFVFVNAPFDLMVMAQARPSLLPQIFQAFDDERIYDVATRQKLMDIAAGEYTYWRTKGYSMKRLAQRLLDRDIAKGDDTYRLRYSELDGVPLDQWPPEAVEYALGDPVHTLDIFLAQEAELEEDGAQCILEDQHRQCRADFALKLASAWGLRTDRHGIERLREECEQVMAVLERGLIDCGFIEEKILKSGKNKGQRRLTKKKRPVQEAMAKVVGDKAKLTPKGKEYEKEHGESPVKVEFRGTGEYGEDGYELGTWDIEGLQYISIDKEACADSGDPDLMNYSEYAQTSTFLRGHVTSMWAGIETPIHTRYEVLLETGRTSSSDPNVQNVRSKEGARECFKPREGNCYIGIDVDRAELHTLAQVCHELFGHSTLGEALNKGYDPHTGLGATLAHCSYEELAAALERQDYDAQEKRKWAKPANFGLPGGMGVRGFRAYAKFQYGLVLSYGEADRIVNGWKVQWPDIADDYLGWIRTLMNDDNYAVIKHFYSNRIRGRTRYCAAANGFFQGLSADAIKDALYHISKRCYVEHPGSALYGCRIVNEVHDEIILEAPLDIASDAAYEARDLLVERYNTWTPDYPVKSTPVLMDVWSKKAQSLVGADGRLQVWHYGS
jgi:hypothetical protein